MFRTVFMYFLLITAALTNYAAAGVTYHVGSIREISQGCAPSEEVEQAVDPTHSKYVYEAWIGCGGIGFARSTNGGVRFSAPVTMPQSGGSWDPSLAVAPVVLIGRKKLCHLREAIPMIKRGSNYGVNLRATEHHIRHI